MTRQISDRQAGIMLAMSIVSLKLLILPALLSKYTIRYSYLTVLAGFAIDFLFIMLMWAVLTKFPHLTFGELIERSFGKIVRYILNFGMGIYFFFKGVLIIKETHNYFNETLFENISWWVFVVPFLMLVFFITIKDLKTISRSVEFFFWIMVAGVVLTVFVPLKSVDFSNLLPLFSAESSGVGKSLLYCNFSFGDFFMIVMFMGRTNVKHNSTKKVFSYALITDLLVVIFYIVFVAMFGKISVRQSLAISDLPLHSSVSSAISRLDWIIIIIWAIILIFQAGIWFSMSCSSITESFKFKNKYIPATLTILAVFAVIYSYYLNLEGIIDLVFSLPFAIVTLSFQILYPIIIMVAAFFQKDNCKYKATDAVFKGQIKIQYTDINKPTKLKNNKTFSNKKIAGIKT